MALDTKKRAPRKSLRQSGWITLEGGFAARPCVVHDLSSAGASYRGSDDAGASVCEHVALHAAIRARHGRIFINPALINSGYNRHSFDALPGSVVYRHVLRLRRKLLDGLARLKATGRS